MCAEVTWQQRCKFEWLFVSIENRVDPSGSILGLMFSIHSNSVEIDCINVEGEDKSTSMSAKFWYRWKLILWMKWIQWIQLSNLDIKNK